MHVFLTPDPPVALNKQTIPLDTFSASEEHVTKEPDAWLRRQTIQEGLQLHRDVTRTSEVLLVVAISLLSHVDSNCRIFL